MSEEKISVSKTSTTRSRRSRKGPRSRQISFARLVSAASQSIMYRATWSAGLINSGTTGTLSSSSIGFSIQNSTEYSPLTSLYSQVRLRGAIVTFTPKLQIFGAVLHDTMYVGTRPDANQTTPPSAPTLPQHVENCQNPRTIGTYGTSTKVYQVYVPPALEYANIATDAPSTPTPWAGSPGSLMIYATNLTTSANYFNITVTCVWQLRARL